MQTVTTVGLDIAKSVFQVHGIDAKGDVIIRRQLKRRYVLAFFQKLPSCLVGIEACASSHHWSRELTALGHTVRLMPPAYVKPYVKRQKNDMADAEAICEAVTRATMRFVPTKTPEQQSCLMLHRTRHLFIRQQTAVINSIRAYLAEFGIVAPVGRKGVEELLHVVADPSDKRVPEIARACLAALGAQLLILKEQIVKFDRMIMAWHRSNETSKRLHYIPGVGPMLATALVASVADPRTFRSGRNFSAWIGLVPKQHSSGGKDKLGSISKQGDRYLRSLFVAGALAVIRYAKMNPTVPQTVIDEAMERDPISAAAEFGAQFRRDIESFVLREAVAACVSSSVFERAPQRDISYVGFADPSGGSADSMTLAIGHKDYDRKTVVVDALREARPPFSPETVADEFARLLMRYRIMRITGDRYAGEWPREQFSKFGIRYEATAKSKSDMYVDLLPLINSRQIDLLDHTKLINQLCSLERRTARSGRDSIDHPPHGHDDLINAVAGLAAAVTKQSSYNLDALAS